jgi:acyl-CoA reductase-like NAD-dependent aldehyde dehydrogenase
VQLLAQVEAAIQGGARLLMGGRRMALPGAFMQTTILSDIQPGNPAYREEFFGPVICFYRVADEEAAIALANDSDFGLGGSVWTRDEARGKRVAQRIHSGMLFVNNIDWADAELPFGGIHDSGYGRELGHLGIQEACFTCFFWRRAPFRRRPAAPRVVHHGLLHRLWAGDRPAGHRTRFSHRPDRAGYRVPRGICFV